MYYIIKFQDDENQYLCMNANDSGADFDEFFPWRFLDLKLIGLNSANCLPAPNVSSRQILRLLLLLTVSSWRGNDAGRTIV